MDFFSSDGSYIYLEKPYCEFYIPLSYFEESSGFATDNGDMLKVLGVFDVCFFENGKVTDKKMLNLPTFIDLYVYSSEVGTADIPGIRNPNEKYKIVKYFKGDKIMSNRVVKDSDNVEAYLGYITKGKLPPSIPYDKSILVWRKNQEINGVRLGVPSVIEELILSVSYRDVNDLTKKFASVIGREPNTSQYDYKMASIRQICQYASTFTGLTFEDIDSMITTALNRSRENTPEASSPIEDIIKM